MPPKNQKSKASRKAAAAPKEVPAPKGGKGKQASGPPVAVAANAPSKKQQKLSKQEERLMRQQETDAMLIIPDEDDCYAPMIEVEEAAPRKAAPVDSFGNTLSKAAQAQSKEDAKIEIMRAEARARRKAKEDLRLHAEQAAAPPSTDSDHVFNKVKDTLDVEEVRQKLAGGVKLTHKESKLLQRAEAQEAEAVSMQQEADEGLSSFSLSVRSERGQGDETTMSAVDVIVNSFTITAPSKPLLIDASLRIVAGKRYGLMGPNGKGKTTLLKFLASRRLPIPSGMDVHLVQQEVAASDDSVVDQVLAADAARKALFAEEQELMAAFEIQEGLIASGEYAARRWSEDTWAEKLARFSEVGQQLEASGADASESKVRRILTGLGFTEAMQDGPSTTLSGGWRMRVALATALFMEPKLLCLDEPTNHLDLNAVLWLEDYLSTQWTDKSIVVVSHDAAFLEEICTNIIHLDSCKLNYYSGSYWAFAAMHDQIEAKKLREYNSEQKAIAEMKKIGIKADKVEKKVLQKLNKSVLTDKPKEYKVSFSIQSPEEHGAAVDLRDVSFAYAGSSRSLFSHVTAKIDTYSRVSIVGPNGAGKSSLLRLFTGALTPTAGEVLSHSRIRIGCYHQHFEELLSFDLSPVDYLTQTYSVTVTIARKYLGMFGLDGPRHLIKIGHLSGGQKARVVFASLSLQMPHILVLDEPTNHLDMESVEALVEGINSFTGGVVIVSHDARLIEATQCELWVCGDGETGLRVEKGGFEKYRRDVMRSIQRLAELAALKAARRFQAKKVQREAVLCKLKASQSKK